MLLEDDEISRVKQYLKEPVSSGLWSINIDWDENNKLEKLLTKEFVDYSDKEIEKKNISNERQRRLSARNRHMLHRLKNRLYNPEYFINFLFDVINLGEDNDRPHYFLRNKSVYEDFMKEYEESVKYFSERFHSSLEDNESYYEKSDNTILINGEMIIHIDENIYVSTLKAPLNELLELLKKFDLIKNNTKISMYFSPEEEIIKPYYYYTRSISEYLFDEHTLRIFNKSFDEYESDEYENSISKLGKASEEILIQIYETLFRMPLHNGLTIGQLYDKINKDISVLYRPATTNSSNFSDIHNELNKHSDYNPNIIRKIIKLLINEQKFINQEIRNRTNNNLNKYLFPVQLRKNIEDLIRYRNAASHKSRTFLGEHEALKMLYYFVSLYLWWKSQYDSINWDLNKEDIIDNLVQ